MISTWVSAGFFVLTILIWGNIKLHMEPKELWKVLFALSLLYTLGYGSVALYYAFSLAFLHKLPYEMSIYGKSFPAIIALSVSASLLIVLAYLASLAKNRGDEKKALRDVLLGRDKILTFYTATVLLMFLVAILGRSAYYASVNGQVLVMYSYEVLLAMWAAIVAALSPVIIFFRNIKYYIGIPELRRALEAVIILVYLQVFLGGITSTITTIFEIQIYWVMNIAWLIISASVIFLLYSTLILPYAKIRASSIVASKKYSSTSRRIEERTLLIEYCPKISYGRKVFELIFSSKFENIIIAGLPSKYMFRSADLIRDRNVVKIPITVSGVSAEGISITNLSLLFHTIASFLSKYNAPTLIVLDDLTDLIIANDIRTVYILLSQLLEILGNNGFFSLLNADALDAKDKALIEGLFDKIVYINEKGELEKIKD